VYHAGCSGRRSSRPPCGSWSGGFPLPGRRGRWRSPQRTAPLAAGISERARQRLPGQRKPVLGGGSNCRTGAQDRPAGAGDRFFEGVVAAHRGTADAAGVDWKSAIYRKVEEEVKAGRGMTIERMVKLGRVSRTRLLSLRLQRSPGLRSPHGSARRHTADCAGLAQRSPADHDRAFGTRQKRTIMLCTT